MKRAIAKIFLAILLVWFMSTTMRLIIESLRNDSNSIPIAIERGTGIIQMNIPPIGAEEAERSVLHLNNSSVFVIRIPVSELERQSPSQKMVIYDVTPQAWRAIDALRTAWCTDETRLPARAADQDRAFQIIMKCPFGYSRVNIFVDAADLPAEFAVLLR